MTSQPVLGLTYYGEFAKIAHVMALYEAVRVAALDLCADVVLLLPDDVLPGVTRAWGLPVVRDGLTPMLGLIPKPVGALD